jgi:hypothetical protein
MGASSARFVADAPKHPSVAGTGILEEHSGPLALPRLSVR